MDTDVWRFISFQLQIRVVKWRLELFHPEDVGSWMTRDLRAMIIAFTSWIDF